MGLPRVDRLTAEDERILALEHGAVAGHLCKVLILGGRLDATRLRVAMARGLPAVPRLRQRLEILPAGFGRPLWVEDTSFDIGWHVRDVPVPEPLDDRGLRRFVASRMEERLDRSRPLWRVEIVALADDRTAIVWRIHHCMADGFESMRIGAACIWSDAIAPSPKQPATAAVPTPTVPAPTRGSLLAAAGWDRCTTAARSARALGRELAGARHWRDGLAQARAVAASARRELRSSPVRPYFDAPLSRSRAVAWRALPLHRLHEAAKRIAPDATLNDAVLALVASGVREWSRARGADQRSLTLRVPVSLHAGAAGAGNRDSYFDVDVAMRDEDIAQCVRGINEQTVLRKAAHDAQHIDQLRRALDAVPLGAHVMALADGAHHFSMCVSNVVGPREPIAVEGVPVVELHAIVEVAQHHDLRASAISCGDILSVALCADAGVVKPETVMRGIDGAWRQLEHGAAAG